MRILLVMFAVCCIAVPAAAAEGLPMVKTSFVIDSQTITRRLGGKAPRETLEQQLAAAIATEAATTWEFGFVDWQPDTVPGDPAARFKVTLAEVEVPNAPSAYFLRYNREIYDLPGGTAKLELKFGEADPLYASGIPNKPLGNPTRLTSDVLALATKHLHRNNPEDFKKMFLYIVPLSRKAPAVDDRDQIYKVALPYQALKTAADSVLRVEFYSKRTDRGETGDGYVVLTELNAACADCPNAQVKARHTTFYFIQIGEVPKNGWNPEIQQILNDARITKATVVMRHYSPDYSRLSTPE